MHPDALRLRPVTPEDAELLFRLYASTRAHEVAAWGWPPPQAEAFLRLQWRAQAQGYAARYPPEGHQVVEVRGQPVGRLWVAQGAQEVRLVDVALLPEWRGRGLGTELVAQVQQEARRGGLPLRLHVTRDNPARRLYLRLGFVPVGPDVAENPYLALEWRAVG